MQWYEGRCLLLSQFSFIQLSKTALVSCRVIYLKGLLDGMNIFINYFLLRSCRME